MPLVYLWNTFDSGLWTNYIFKMKSILFEMKSILFKMESISRPNEKLMTLCTMFFVTFNVPAGRFSYCHITMYSFHSFHHSNLKLNRFNNLQVSPISMDFRRRAKQNSGILFWRKFISLELESIKVYAVFLI